MKDASLSALELLELEYVCQGYESKGEHGPAAIDATLQLAKGQRWQRALLFELLATDFQYFIGKGFSARERLLTTEYRHTLVALADPGLYARALEVEFECRSRFGDQPQCSEFLDWIGGDEAGVDHITLQQILADIQPIAATVFVDQSPRFTFDFLGALVFGRKGRDDPEPIAFLPQHQAMAPCLIVTEEKYVSRRQLHLSRIAAGAIRATNTGSRLPIKLNGIHELPPGATEEFNRLVSLEFHNVAVSLRWSDILPEPEAID